MSRSTIDCPLIANEVGHVLPLLAQASIPVTTDDELMEGSGR